jgi:hypothetical protein
MYAQKSIHRIKLKEYNSLKVIKSSAGNKRDIPNFPKYKIPAKNAP